MIGARARRLNRRIDDLLRVARSESGQIELDDQPFDLARAAEAAIEDVRPARPPRPGRDRRRPRPGAACAATRTGPAR